MIEHMRKGALFALGLLLAVCVVWGVANLLYAIWKPLGPITLVAATGGAIGALVYWVERTI